MSESQDHQESKPVPPSRAYRNARKNKRAAKAVQVETAVHEQVQPDLQPQLPEAQTPRVPMPAPPVLVRLEDSVPDADPAIEVQRWQEPEIELPAFTDSFGPEGAQAADHLATEEAATDGSTPGHDVEPEPYSPFRVPPTRQLPDMVFAAPGTSDDGPAPKPRSTLSIVLGAFAIVGVLAVGLIGYNSFTQVAERNPLQGQLTSGAQIGQCYTDQVRFVDCASSHTFEVYGTNLVAERSDYPGVVSRTLGSEACELRFFGYVGLEPAVAGMSIYSVYPSQEQWAAGERWEICVLSNESLNPLFGSATASIS